jgi:hypothetical protein
MAAHAAHFPRRRRWPQRLLGLLATAALLGSGVAIAYMVLPQDKATSPPAPNGAAATAPKPKAGLTKAQKRARHAAVAKVHSDGYDVVRLADWRAGPKLKVLIGTTDAGAMRAFFFSGSKFVGHDDADTSSSVRVVKAGKDAVTLAYRVTTGGAEKVRFELQDGKPVVTGGTMPSSTIR